MAHLKCAFVVYVRKKYLIQTIGEKTGKKLCIFSLKLSR